MRDLTLGDYTQRIALGELANTERLLASAASRLSRRERFAEIIALPDLGLPHNVQRILGGFFTGAAYRWESDVPMVPVDATVNVCGVSVFRLSEPFESVGTFRAAVERTRQQLAASSLVWNYASGNHFVSWCRVEDSSQTIRVGDYLVLHASPAEYKNQFNGLYPSPGNWYHSHIEEYSDDSVPGRRLRLLTGSRAERFFRWAKLLEPIFHERQEFVAATIADGEIERVASVLHYGMPTDESVAIGCNWLDVEAPQFVLLTEPGAPLFLIEAFAGSSNTVELDRKRILTPHGLGVTVGSDVPFRVHDGRLEIGSTSLTSGQSLRDTDLIAIRRFAGEDTLSSILAKCPGIVLGQLNQIASYHRKSDPLPKETQ